MSAEEFKKVFARNLIFYRTKKKMSCEELSLRLGKDEDFIYNLEGELDTWTAMCIASELNILLSQLIYGDIFINEDLSQGDRND